VSGEFVLKILLVLAPVEERVHAAKQSVHDVPVFQPIFQPAASRGRSP
jgi:hypothetical protein